MSGKLRRKVEWLALLTLTVAIQGKVLSFDAGWVEIQGTDGRRQHVPRQYIVERGPLQEDSVVTARLTLAQLAELAETWPGSRSVAHDQPAVPAKARGR